MNKVSVEKIDDVTLIKLDDGKVNACSIEFLEEFKNTLDNASKNKGAVCILGRKGFFTAGFDLKTFQSGDLNKIQKMYMLGFNILTQLFLYPRPIVIGCTGHAIGLGVFLLCCGDYRYGAKGPFKIHANEVVNSMVIPTELMRIAESRILKTHTNRLLLNGEAYPIEKTINTGLIDDIVNEKKIKNKCLEKAKQLCDCQHPFYEETKLISRIPVLEKIKKK